MGSLVTALVAALAMYLPPSPAVLSQATPPVATATFRYATLPDTDAPAPQADPTPEETKVLELLNAARTEHSLPALAIDSTLITVARAHSEDMQVRDYFSHWEPDDAHRSPTDRYAARLGHRPTVVVGENLAVFTHPDFDAIQQALMDSPKHRENILDPEYVYVGIGVLIQPDGHTWVTQMFRGDERKAG